MSSRYSTYIVDAYIYSLYLPHLHIVVGNTYTHAVSRERTFCRIDWNIVEYRQLVYKYLAYRHIELLYGDKLFYMAKLTVRKTHFTNCLILYVRNFFTFFFIIRVKIFFLLFSFKIISLHIQIHFKSV